MQRPPEDAADYQQFQALPGADSAANAGLATIAGGIAADLVASKGRLAAVYLALSLLGYAATLALCAQNGVGIFALSGHAELLVHHHLPHPWCAVLCGVLFSGIPAVVAFAALNRFQRRYLLFKMWWLPLFVPVVACFGLLLAGELPGDLIGGGGWSLAFRQVWLTTAILTPYLAEGVVALAMRQRGLSAQGDANGYSAAS